MTKVMTSLPTSLLIFLAIEQMDMGRDVTAFRERFKAYKNGKPVSEIYDAGLPRYAEGTELPIEQMMPYILAVENPTKQGLANGIWRPPTDSSKWDTHAIGGGLDIREENNPIVYNYLKSKGRLNNPYLTVAEEEMLRKQTFEKTTLPALRKMYGKYKDKISEKGYARLAGMKWQGHPYLMAITPDSITGKAFLNAVASGDRDLDSVFDAYYKYPANAKRYGARINADVNYWKNYSTSSNVEPKSELVQLLEQQDKEKFQPWSNYHSPDYSLSNHAPSTISSWNNPTSPAFNTSGLYARRATNNINNVVQDILFNDKDVQDALMNNLSKNVFGGRRLGFKNGKLPGYRGGKPENGGVRYNPMYPVEKPLTSNQQYIQEDDGSWIRLTNPGMEAVVTARRPNIESDEQYTARRIAETQPKRTWLSNAADMAHVVKETAMALDPYTAIPYFGARVGEDMLNDNIGLNTVLNGVFALTPFKQLPQFTLTPITDAATNVIRPIRNFTRRLDRDYGNFVLWKNDQLGRGIENEYISAMGETGTKIQNRIESDPVLLERHYYNQDLQKLKDRLPGFDKLEQDLLQRNKESYNEIKQLFEEFPEYEYFILRTGKNPLDQESVKSFLDLQGSSVRGFHTSDKNLIQQNLTEAYPQARSFQAGGDRLRSDGGNYQSNSLELAERFRHTLTPLEGESGYIGFQNFDFQIPNTLPIQQQLRLYKDQIFNANYFPFNKQMSKAIGKLPGRTTPNIVEAEYMGRGNVKAANERAYINNEPTNQFSPEYEKAMQKVTKAAEEYWKLRDKLINPLQDELENLAKEIQELSQSNIFYKLNKNGSNYQAYIDRFPEIDYTKANTYAKIERYNELKQKFQTVQNKLNVEQQKLKPLEDEIDKLRINAEEVLAPGKNVMTTKKLDVTDNITEGHGRWDTANRSEDLFIPVSFGIGDMKQYIPYFQKGLFSRTNVREKIIEASEKRMRKRTALAQEGSYVYPIKRNLFDFLYKHRVKPRKQLVVPDTNLDYSLFTGTF